MRKIFVITFFVLSYSSSIFSQAQYNVLLNFNGKNGANPHGSLAYLSGLLYGLTPWGGAYDSGCIFSVDTNGNRYKDLFDFNSTTGQGGSSDFITLLGNKIYGASGGKNDYLGNIFSLDTNGSGFKTQFSFDNIDGADIFGTLIFSSNKIYGVTYRGGDSNDNGTIFSIDTNGNGFKTLFNFNGTTGSLPTGLTLVRKMLYGSTSEGGKYGGGVVFCIDTDGNGYKKLWDFNNTDTTNGMWPCGTIKALGSKLYGMTELGGIYNGGVVFSIDTSSGGYKSLLYFNGYNGERPVGSLTISGTTLYGMTAEGGAGLDSEGVIFSIDTGGKKYIDMFNFTGLTGAYPGGSLTLYGKSLFGMTWEGGINNDGVIFKIDTDAVAGINDIAMKDAIIKVYPNPCNGVFTLQTNGQLLMANNYLEIYNMLGEEVYSQSLPQSQNSTINLTGQPNGVYFYRVVTEMDNLVGKGKVVVQR